MRYTPKLYITQLEHIALKSYIFIGHFFLKDFVLLFWHIFSPHYIPSKVSREYIPKHKKYTGLLDYSAWLILFCSGTLWTVGLLFLVGVRNSKPAKSLSIISFVAAALSMMILGVYTADSTTQALRIHYVNSLWGFLFVGYAFMVTDVLNYTKFLSKKNYKILSITLALIILFLELVFKQEIHRVVELDNGYSIQILPFWANDIMSVMSASFLLILATELFFFLRSKSENIHRKRLVRLMALTAFISILVGIPIFSTWFFTIPIQITMPLFYLIAVALNGFVIYYYGLFEPNSQLVTQKILQNTTNFLLVVDNNGIIKETNAKIKELTELSIELYLNQDVNNLIPYIEIVLNDFKGNKLFTTDFFMKKTEEHLFPVELFISEIKDKNRRIGYLIMGNDLTHHMEVQGRLKDYALTLESHSKELEKKNEELKNFANIVSHDLRSPLNTISGFVGLLERKNKEILVPGSQEYIDFIKKGCSNMSDIINTLLHLAKYGSDKLDIQKINLQDIVENAILNLQAKITVSNTSFSFGRLHTIHADGVQMLQLFQNLIENAIKYAKEDIHPVINIYSRSNNFGTQIIISDNGIGISEENQKKIFNIFEQVNLESAGVGLGLATCKKIIDNHNGSIEVDSKEGIGTTFKIFIPSKQYNPQVDN